MRTEAPIQKARWAVLIVTYCTSDELDLITYEIRGSTEFFPKFIVVISVKFYLVRSSMMIHTNGKKAVGSAYFFSLKSNDFSPFYLILSTVRTTLCFLCRRETSLWPVLNQFIICIYVTERHGKLL